MILGLICVTVAVAIAATLVVAAVGHMECRRLRYGELLQFFVFRALPMAAALILCVTLLGIGTALLRSNAKPQTAEETK